MKPNKLQLQFRAPENQDLKIMLKPNFQKILIHPLFKRSQSSSEKRQSMK